MTLSDHLARIIADLGAVRLFAEMHHNLPADDLEQLHEAQQRISQVRQRQTTIAKAG